MNDLNDVVDENDDGLMVLVCVCVILKRIGRIRRFLWATAH